MVQALRQGGFFECTPLWYYVLREADVREGGLHLGELGNRIVAGTIIGVLVTDAESYLFGSRNLDPSESMPVAGGPLMLPDGRMIQTIHDLLQLQGRKSRHQAEPCGRCMALTTLCTAQSTKPQRRTPGWTARLRLSDYAPRHAVRHDRDRTAAWPWTLVRSMVSPRHSSQPQPAKPALSGSPESRIRGARVVWTLVRPTHRRSGDIGEAAVDCGEHRSTADQGLSEVIPWSLVSQF
ncbi:hypothetical protein GCM10011504_49230 [Siccirubricoccus deserti]|nr:hypothetical protein GCM10011504_49230 [Siccirubricoccus deserti]